MAKVIELLTKEVIINPKSSTGQYILAKYGGSIKIKIKAKAK